MAEQYLRSTGHASYKGTDGKRVTFNPGDVVPDNAVPRGVLERWIDRGAVEIVTPDVPLQAAPAVEEPFEGADDMTVADYLEATERVLRDASDAAGALKALAHAWAFEYQGPGRKGVYEGLATLGGSDG